MNRYCSPVIVVFSAFTPSCTVVYWLLMPDWSTAMAPMGGEVRDEEGPEFVLVADAVDAVEYTLTEVEAAVTALEERVAL